jgi:hypothetical protein
MIGGALFSKWQPGHDPTGISVRNGETRSTFSIPGAEYNMSLHWFIEMAKQLHWMGEPVCI